MRITSDEGYICYTRPDGSVLWTESSLLGRDVSFRIAEKALQPRITWSWSCGSVEPRKECAQESHDSIEVAGVGRRSDVLSPDL